MSAIWEKNWRESVFFLLSILLHILVFLYLYFNRVTEPPHITHFVHLVETEKRISKEEIEEIKKKIEKVDRETTIKKEQSKTRTQDKEILTKGSDKQEDFEKSFEEMLFSRNQATTQTVTGKSDGGDVWSEQSHKGGSGTQKEAVQARAKVPDGSARPGKVNWRGGYSRSLQYMPAPEYPLEYRRQGIQAEVLLEAEVDATGRVISVTVLRSSGYPELDILAKNSVRRARFSPSSVANQIDVGEIAVRFELAKR